jgi:DNA-binding NarL/FixJ family response regulator
MPEPLSGQVAALAGLTSRQIAERLCISPRTAAVHVSSVLYKLGVPDRIQAAHLGRKLHSQNSRVRDLAGARHLT